MTSQPTEDELVEFADSMLNLPFVAEFWDTKTLGMSDLVGVYRAVQILKDPSEIEDYHHMRAARTIGFFLPRFPRRVAFYSFYDLYSRSPYQVFPELVELQMTAAAPWLRGPDTTAPARDRLCELLVKMHERATKTVDAFLDEDKRSMADAIADVHTYEEEMAQILDDGHGTPGLLRFLGGMSF